MARTIRIMTIDDVETDEDLLQYFQYMRKLIIQLMREWANASSELSAMLKVHDDRAQAKRRGRVIRPLALAAGLCLVVGRYMTLASRRFKTEYAPEIEMNKNRRRRVSARTIKFGDN